MKYFYEEHCNNTETQNILYSKSRAAVSESSRKESKVIVWSRISDNTGSRSRIFCPIPTPDVQLDLFLHHTPKMGILVEMVQFLLKLLLKQRFLAVYHDFRWF